MSAKFIVSKASFEQIFPERNQFYTYEGLVEATAHYPEFTTTGGEEVALREAAAFLANVSHETHGLVYVREVNESLYHHYCDPDQEFGCPAGQSMYFGRGPIQLSWNFNYFKAGEALGYDLLNHPELVEEDSTIAWATALWYWNTEIGPGNYTCHDGIVGGHGFRETIRTINGPLECDGGNPRQVNNRVDLYQRTCSIIGATPGDNLTC